jgi:hypothetical protein
MPWVGKVLCCCGALPSLSVGREIGFGRAFQMSGKTAAVILALETIVFKPYPLIANKHDSSTASTILTCLLSDRSGDDHPGASVGDRRRAASNPMALARPCGAVLAPTYGLQPRLPSRACHATHRCRWHDGLDSGDPDTGRCIGATQCLSKHFDQNGSRNQETRCGRCSTSVTYRLWRSRNAWEEMPLSSTACSQATWRLTMALQAKKNGSWPSGVTAAPSPFSHST